MSENQPPITHNFTKEQMRGLGNELLGGIPPKARDSRVVEPPSGDESTVSLYDMCVAEGKRIRGSESNGDPQESPRRVLVGIASTASEQDISQDSAPGDVYTGDSQHATSQEKLIIIREAQERYKNQRRAERAHRSSASTGSQRRENQPDRPKRAYVRRTHETPEERAQRQRAYYREKQEQYRRQAKNRTPEATPTQTTQTDVSELIDLLYEQENIGFPGRGRINSRGERVSLSGKVLPAKPLT